MKTVGIPTPIRSIGHQNLFNKLGEIFDVRFKECISDCKVGIDAWLITGAGENELCCTAQEDRPCYTVVQRDQLVSCGEGSEIQFGGHSEIPPVLKGMAIKTDEAILVKALPERLERHLHLATKGGAPIWAAKFTKKGAHHYVSLPIPELENGESLFQHFKGKKFLQLLPILVFLRNLAMDNSWEPPPLQACFMVDDPNLHWPTYGFIDFMKMAAHAERHNYHVSFATIPIDAWFVHKYTASLFNNCRDRLSLIFHGNDHITNELGRPYSESEKTLLLEQALDRIAGLERRSGLEVARVMAPPHGACSESMLGALARMGFEAACISSGSLQYHNSKAGWGSSIGMGPSSIIAGLTIFPRFRISPDCHNDIILAALLNQPIIPVGHHGDFEWGLQITADLAQFINSLGDVRWTDMKQISRAHYSRRKVDNVLEIKMHSKNIEVCVSDGTDQIRVERPWLRRGDSEMLAWRCPGEISEWQFCHPDAAIPVLSGSTIEISSAPQAPPQKGRRRALKQPVWPIVRRGITEARDRIMPVIHRVTGNG